jgi:hypothetical protein
VSALLASRPMGLVVWTTFSLLLWIVLWALGSKAWDAMMLSVGILLVAVTVHAVTKYRPSSRT